MSAVFQFQNVSKRFGGDLALDQVTYSGTPGEVIALLGENGAGKTTSIKILLGLMQPDAGSSSVMGMDSRQQGTEIRRRVGYVPDRPALYEWMTVAEIGWFAAGFYPLGYETNYKKYIQQFGLPLDRKIKTLSKGTQSKVLLSLAMSHEPQLLVLDEPTSGLDPLVRREFLESMVDVAAAGRTVFLSSHQIVEVERVADIVLIMRAGRIVVNECLETLKSRVVEITVTQDAIDTAPPPLPAKCTLLDARRQNRQWRLYVRDLPDDGINFLRANESLVDVSVRHPSLEEIFVTCMQSDDAGRWADDERPVADLIHS